MHIHTHNSNIYEFKKPEKEKLEEYRVIKEEFDKYIVSEIIDAGYIKKINTSVQLFMV
jgi:3-deoxy-D-arabino-heptulosonate 7-phosphate (DAHP) synthase